MPGSRLFGLARQASEYMRRRGSATVRQADRRIDTSQQGQGSDYMQTRRSLYDRMREYLFGGKSVEDQPPVPPGGMPTLPGAPPVFAPPQSIPSGGLLPGSSQQKEADKPQLLGRDISYDDGDFDAAMEGMRLVSSSNVYGYYFERESRTMGILYVTFLETLKGGKRGDGPGPTYAYYNVPVRKAVQFQRASEESAGAAVWDYLRVRGSVFAHQHMYRLIHVAGEYIPRKATALGFKSRAVAAPGVGRRTYRRSTLAPVTFGRGDPRRGDPVRGEPDRGRPG